jgi:alkylation response protein AidB-like acyl-CoA dehydrogenase
VIDLAENEDQEQIVAAVGAVLADAAADAHSDRGKGGAEIWQAAVELGWLGLEVPEELGGAGCGLADQVLVFREYGRYLAPTALLGGVLALAVTAGAAGLNSPGKPGAVHIAGLLRGEHVVAIAIPRTDPDTFLAWDPGGSDLVLIIEPDSVALVPMASTRRLYDRPSIDPGYRLAALHWDRTGQAYAGGRVQAAATRQRAQLLGSAMLAGIAARTRDMSASFARDRVQYGRPIGAFQAVKHRCADMAVRAEAAWCITALAAVELQEQAAGGEHDVRAAALVAAAAALDNARDNIQNHGAIGFTDEHDAHRFLSRAHLVAALVADPQAQAAGLLAAASPW